jgi:lysophospholipase L1-like esterase
MGTGNRTLARSRAAARALLRRLAGMAGGIALLSGEAAGGAGQAIGGAASGPSDDACATAPAIDEQDVAPIIARFIVPAKGFDLSGIAPAVMARFGALQAAQAKHQTRDWPDLCRYRDQNAAILRGGKHPRVVFLGDSITEFWRFAQPDLFDGMVVDRGISGQTTPQILLRFYADVVALRPRVVHIMAGTNDIAGNTGPASDDQIIDNIRAMVDIAAVNRIRVVLGSITPAAANSGDRPAGRIRALNARLRELARQRGAIFVDYYAALSDGRDGIRPALANDMLHPNRDGYAVMRPLTERALAAALS